MDKKQVIYLHNTTVHLYEGCTEEQYKETASRTVLAFKFLQDEITKELPQK